MPLPSPLGLDKASSERNLRGVGDGSYCCSCGYYCCCSGCCSTSSYCYTSCYYYSGAGRGDPYLWAYAYSSISARVLPSPTSGMDLGVSGSADSGASTVFHSTFLILEAVALPVRTATYFVRVVGSGTGVGSTKALSMASALVKYSLGGGGSGGGPRGVSSAYYGGLSITTISFGEAYLSLRLARGGTPCIGDPGFVRLVGGDYEEVEVIGEKPDGVGARDGWGGRRPKTASAFLSRSALSLASSLFFSARLSGCFCGLVSPAPSADPLLPFFCCTLIVQAPVPGKCADGAGRR